eukprot:6195717-Pleurochrysis_carterae.AAC.1
MMHMLRCATDEVTSTVVESERSTELDECRIINDFGVATKSRYNNDNRDCTQMYGASWRLDLCQRCRVAAGPRQRQRGGRLLAASCRLSSLAMRVQRPLQEAFCGLNCRLSLALSMRKGRTEKSSEVGGLGRRSGPPESGWCRESERGDEAV